MIWKLVKGYRLQIEVPQKNRTNKEKNNMEINFVIKDEDKYLKIISTGFCNNLFQLKEYVLALQEAAVSSGQTRLLVDETHLEYTLSTLDTYNSGCFLAQLSPNPKKFAILCKTSGWNDAKFWETVAVNRGVNVRVFDDRVSAENWLFNLVER